MDLDKTKLFNSFLKAVSASMIALAATMAFNIFIIPSADIYWAMVAVTFGSFFTAFFTDYSDGKIVESKDEITEDEKKYAAMSLAAIAILLNTAPSSSILPLILTLGAVIFLIYSFRSPE